MSSSSSRQKDWSARGRRPPAPARPPPACRFALALPAEATPPPSTLSGSPSASSLLWLLSTSRPSAPQCAAEHHRSHCRPLDLSSLPRAPPLHPRPPHRAARRWMPHNAAFALVFNLGHRRSPLGFRRRQAFPEHAEITVDPAVSSSTEPLSPRRRFPALAPPTIRADSSSPPAMSPPRLRPCKHAFKLTTELTAPPRV